MSAEAKAVRFMHLADLHLEPCLEHGHCGPDDQACSACIKVRILERLAKRLRDTRPDLLLLAGDLTERRDKRTGGSPAVLRAIAAPLDRLTKVAREQGTVVAGVTGDHDGDDSTDALRRELDWNWLLKTGEVNRKAGVAVYGIEGKPRREGVHEAHASLRVEPGEPSVLLAHDELRVIRRHKASAFQYYALGHDHHGQAVRIRPGSDAIAAYPGHLFSYWDGDGKAWRAFAVEGELRPDGRVSTTLLPLSSLGIPETRRLFVEYRHAHTPGGTLTLENAPPPEYFAQRGIAARCDEDAVGGVLLRYVVEVDYRSRAELSALVTTILTDHANDVFTCPAGTMRHQDRADYGRRLLTSRRFGSYLTNIIKRTPVTQ